MFAKRSMILVCIWLLCFSVGFSAFAENDFIALKNSKTVENIYREDLGFVAIGYNLKDEEEIFGSNSRDSVLDGIGSLLDEIVKESDKMVTNNKILDLRLKSLNESFGNKLTMVVSDGINTVSIGNKIEDNVIPYTYDERPVVKNFQFAFRFQSPNGGYFPTSYYLTKVNGMVPYNHNAYISKVTTTHQSGSYFPFTDSYNSTRYAKTIIRNPYTLPSGTINIVGINYTISNNGTISYTITNPSN